MEILIWIANYLVDIYWLKEAFGGDRIVKFDIKPIDGTTIFANLGKLYS